MPRLRLAVVTDSAFAENCYIAAIDDRKDCLVVDPGLEPERILGTLEEEGLTPAAILCTHGHGDHIAGNQRLKQAWPDCPIVIGENDAPLLTDAMQNVSALFGAPVTSPPADETVTAGQIYQAAGFELEVREIPGHSGGHVVYIWHAGEPIHVFGGDVLFAGSIGRTDFPGGSFQALADGIHTKLFTLPDDTVVLPGHGPKTRIGDEKKNNPFVGAPAGYQS